MTSEDPHSQGILLRNTGTRWPFVDFIKTFSCISNVLTSHKIGGYSNTNAILIYISRALGKLMFPMSLKGSRFINSILSYSYSHPSKFNQ